MADEHKEIDALTGTATTGHEWDGIRELNTPLPRWWLWLFYVTIVWAIGYWIVYPAWPLLTNSTQGVFGWHTRSAVVDDLDELKRQRGPMMDKLATASLAEIVADPQLLDFARAQGRVAFADNCAPCHGAGGGGAKGYPNLNDDDWLWGGKLADIEQTIRHGARAGDDKGADRRHAGLRPRRYPEAERDFGGCRLYAARLSGLPAEAGADLAAGKKVFADNCARLSRAGRQGQSRTRRAQPDRQDLALRLRQGDHHARHPQRARRRDAGLGRPPERVRPSRRSPSTSTPSAAERNKPCRLAPP